MKREFQMVIEQVREGWLIADVPAFKGCHTQAKSYDLLIERIKEEILKDLEMTKDKLQN